MKEDNEEGEKVEKARKNGHMVKLTSNYTMRRN